VAAKKNGKLKVGENPFEDSPLEEMRGGGTQFNKAGLDNSSGGFNLRINGVDFVRAPKVGLAGPLVYTHPWNVYYPTAHGEAPPGPPSCASVDDVMGTGTPGGICGQCPKNQFNKAVYDGSRACKFRYAAYIIDQESGETILVDIPGSAVTDFITYCKDLGDYRTVITRIQGVTKERKGSGTKYPTMGFTAEDRITRALIEPISEARARFEGTEKYMLPEGGGQGAIPQAAGGDWK